MNSSLNIVKYISCSQRTLLKFIHDFHCESKQQTFIHKTIMIALIPSPYMMMILQYINDILNRKRNVDSTCCLCIIFRMDRIPIINPSRNRTCMYICYRYTFQLMLLWFILGHTNALRHPNRLLMANYVRIIKKNFCSRLQVVHYSDTII